MRLTDSQSKVIDEFRAWVRSQAASDSRLGQAGTDDREDHSTLRDRWLMVPSVWLEVAIRPFLPQLRVGIVTDDRWKSEDLEDGIESSGDTMNELVELGFSEAGIHEGEPVVEHYRDQGKWFYFATPYEPASLEAINQPEVHDRILKMMDGYYRSFRPLIK